MDKNKQKIIITGALILILIGILFRGALSKKKVPGAGHAQTAGISQQAMTDNVFFLTTVRQSENARSLQEASWVQPWSRDPFTFSGAEGSSPGNPSNFILSGIVWDAHMPVAIINQKVLKINDVIDGCRIQAILRSSVKLVCEDGPYELNLFRPNELSSADFQEKQKTP